MTSFANLFILLSHLPILITCIYAIRVYRKLEGELVFFAFFIFLTEIIQSISLIHWIRHENNLYLLHMYVPLGFICHSLFYNKLLSQYINQKIIGFTLIVFVLFTVLNSLFYQPVTTFNSYAMTIESILLVILSISTFLLLMNSIFQGKTNIKSVNWINSGIFIYYASSLIIFHFSDYLATLSPSVFLKYTWVFHALLFDIMFIFFFLGLWKREQI